MSTRTPLLYPSEYGANKVQENEACYSPRPWSWRETQPNTIAQVDSLEDGMFRPSRSKNRTTQHCSKSLLYSDRILKLLTCLLFGILPWRLVINGSKKKHMYFSFVFVVCQWFCVGTYIFCIAKYWTNPHYLVGEKPISNSAAAIVVGLSVSGAVTFTMTIHYFYREDHNFTKPDDNGGQQLRLIPSIPFQLPGLNDRDSVYISPSVNDWFLTNLLLFVGIALAVFVVGTDFGFDIFYNFKGIHVFTKIADTGHVTQYYMAMTFINWGFCTTICTCCLFFIMSRDLKRHIIYTEKLILSQARTKQDIINYHEVLMDYTDTTKKSFSLWFGLHNIFFIFLMSAIVCEWFSIINKESKKLIGKKEYAELLVAQITGSLFIAYKFGFPFVTASRITAAFTNFYVNLGRKCKVEDTPDFSLLCSQTGFKFLGIRVTTSFALLAVCSSFVGALKFLSDFAIS